MSSSLRYAFLLYFLFWEVGSLYAGWNKILQLNGKHAACGFFWNESKGLIGAGNDFTGTSTQALIMRTTDGGTSWIQSVTPSAIGEVSNIFMKDSLTGYASIYENGKAPRFFSIWKTTDGGITWNDNTFGNTAVTTCVYATSHALIRTTWFDKNVGGFSTDDGRSYTQVFSNGNGDRSNGIDFSDDNNGVAVMGPAPPSSTNPTWFTQNGGVTWFNGSPIPEAWSVYALKGKNTFFALPEGLGGVTPVFNRDLFRSTDGGATWNMIFTFPLSAQFTGHISGIDQTIYVQTDQAVSSGLFRSDDLGMTWKNVGGPSNYRDTRFAVAGCHGEVVYAFDNKGGIWKTTDGGDGTLQFNTLTVAEDTLFLNGSCTSARGYFHCKNTGCENFTIDSISFSPDPNHEFSIDTNVTSLDLALGSQGMLPVLFNTSLNVTRTINLQIHGHTGTTGFTTTIVIVASHSAANGPLLAFGADSLSIANTCDPARGYISLLSRNCDSLIIDSISFFPDPYHEFSLDTSKNGWNLLNDSIGLPILFQCDSDRVRNTFIHVHAHSPKRTFDTTIILRAAHATTPGPILSLAYDSVYLETRYCQPIRRYITFSNLNCDSLIIDSILLDPQYPEFIIDSSQTPKFGLAKYSSGAVPVFYQTDSNLTRRTLMRIIAHSLDRKIDTTIILIAKHSTAPQPILEIPARAKPGEYTLIPVYLRQTQDSFNISHYSFHLSYDGDVLTPASNSMNFYQAHGTLSYGASVTKDNEPNGILCTVNLANPITELSNLSLPLIYLRMYVTLSRNLYSDIQMDTFSISLTDPLPLCQVPEVRFLIDPLCGDSILSRFMLDSTMPGFQSVRPNPASGGSIDADIFIPQAMVLSFDIIDESGKCIRKIFECKEFGKGNHALKIPIASLPAGRYELRMLSGARTRIQPIVIQK